MKEARYQLRQSPASDYLAIPPRPSGAGGAGVRHGIGGGFGHRRTGGLRFCYVLKLGRECGCGAVVAHHLAKVRVASSNLVIRSSETPRGSGESPTVAWPRGEAAACKAVYTGSNPVATSQLPTGLPRPQQRAIGAAVARFPDTEQVTGSIPVSPTTVTPTQRLRDRLFAISLVRSQYRPPQVSPLSIATPVLGRARGETGTLAWRYDSGGRRPRSSGRR